MSKTLASRKQDFKLAQEIADLKKHIDELRSNQVAKLYFADIIIDGTSDTGRITIGNLYLQVVNATKIGFYRVSDNTLVMSLDTSGNIKALGTITGSTSP